MDAELREVIGKVLYEATVDLTSEYTPTWDWLLNKEEWRARAEKVVLVHNEWMREYLKKQLGIKEREDKHPETGLSKQEMTHYRRGETEARMWHFSNKEATREDFEMAGKMWIRHSKSAEHVQELILKGWMSVWKEEIEQKCPTCNGPLCSCGMCHNTRRSCTDFSTWCLNDS